MKKIICPIFLLLLCLACGCTKNEKNENNFTPNEAVKKEIKLLATDGLENLLKGFISDFNENNDSYYISYEEITLNSPDYDEVVSYLNTKLISSDAPDVVIINYNFFQNYVDNGLLLNLTDYFGNEITMKKDDYLESVLNAFVYEDGVYAVPKSFAIGTLMIRKENEEYPAPWDIDSFLTYLEKNPQTALEYDGNKYGVLDLCLRYGLDRYIDFEKGVSYFSDSDFRENLLRINELYDNNDPTRWNVAVENGDRIIVETYIRDFLELQRTRLEYESDMINMGYPSADGNMVCRLLPQNAMGVLASTSEKEGALAVLDFYSTYDKFPADGFSVLTNEFNKQIDEALHIETEYGDDGAESQVPKTICNGVPIYAADNNLIEEIRKAISAGQPDSAERDSIRSIVMEEVNPYFIGDYSVDEAIERIEGRVNLYLAEKH